VAGLGARCEEVPVDASKVGGSGGAGGGGGGGAGGGGVGGGGGDAAAVPSKSCTEHSQLQVCWWVGVGKACK